MPIFNRLGGMFGRKDGKRHMTLDKNSVLLIRKRRHSIAIIRINLTRGIKWSDAVVFVEKDKKNCLVMQKGKAGAYETHL